MHGTSSTYYTVLATLSYREVVSTLHCALENVADRSIEEIIRRIRRKKNKNAKSRFFFTSRGAYVNLLLCTSRRIRWRCLKYVIVNLARDI